MLRRSLVFVLLLGIPAVSFGQGTPERFLSSGSQFYLRWDGIAPHRAAFDKTATGQMLKGETGNFLDQVVKYLTEQSELLNQVDPDVARIAKSVQPALRSVAQNGFSMALDVREINPPKIELTLVFPRSGGAKGPLTLLVKNILEVTGAETKELRVDDTIMQHFSIEPLHWAFGSDGDTAVVTLGTVDPVGVARRGSDKGSNVTRHPLYKELQNFKEFETCSQGFIDIAGLLKPVAALSPEAAKLIDEIGLGGLKNITFQSGFDGPASRSVMDVNMQGERKGLLLMTKGRKFSMKDLPILPADISSFSAGSIDAPLMYDSLTQVVTAGVRAFAPDFADGVKTGIDGIEALIGIKIKDDLLASLGDVVVTYSSPAEGPLGLGQVTMVQVKDAKKLVASFEKIKAAFPGIPGLEFDVKKRSYRGVDLVELHLGASFNTPTFAIHKGWLVFASYPQPVHGHILRSQGILPAWKADEKFLKALEPFPKEFVAVSYSDPRPALELVLSLVPPVMSAINGVTRQFVPGSKSFEIGSIPHPQEASRHLFPNISVTIEDGNRIRYDSRSSLALPF